MPGPHVLVVDDETKTADTVRLYLEHAGYRVTVAHDGAAALLAAGRARPDLVVLDLMLPGVDGLEVCRRLHSIASVPVILLTARTSEEDVLRGLDLGADDYVTKPFSPRELVARVRAVLRRIDPDAAPAAAAPAPGRLVDGALALDRVRHAVTRDGRDVALTPREFRLLEAFLLSPGRAFTREALVVRAFGEDFDGFDRTVDVHVANLRRKIEDDPAHPRRIVTVFGVGYRYEQQGGAS